MHIHLIVVMFVIFLSACDGSSSSSPTGQTQNNIALDEGNVTILQEESNVKLTPGGGNTSSADVVAWRWSEEPIGQGALAVCGAATGFNLEQAARRLEAACTSQAECDFNFDQVQGDDGAVQFDLTVPKLKAPIGLTYRLEADNSAGQTTTANFTFCLLTVNDPPQPVNDNFTATEGTQLVISSDVGINLLSNDVDDLDAGNLPLRVNPVPIKAPTNDPNFTLGEDGGFTYLYVGAATIPAGQSVTDSFTYEVTDGTNTEQADVTITIVTVDKPPFLSEPIPPQTVSVGQSIEIDLKPFFTDPEGSELIFAVVDPGSLPPSGEVVLTEQGVVQGTPAVLDAGSYSIPFTVTDQVSAAAATSAPIQATINLQIDGNLPPLVNQIPNQQIVFGELVSFDVAPFFEDPENDPLRFTMTTTPASSLRINESTGLITGQLRVPNDYTVNLTATDGFNDPVSATFVMTQLTSGNRPPEIVTPPNVNAVINVPIEPIVPQASDADGDELVFAINEIPPGLEFDNTTGTISGTPTEVGNYRIRIRAIDTDQLEAITDVFFINVTAVPNEPPVANAVIADQTIELGEAMEPASANFTDAEGEPLTYTIAPALTPGSGFAFDFASGVLSGTPAALGATTFTISATDGVTNVDANPFTITVVEVGTVNEPPVLGAQISNQSVQAGQAITPVSGQFTDPDGDSLTYTIAPPLDAASGLSLAADGVLSGTPVATETYTITANDGTNSTPTNAFTITVTNNTGNQPPVEDSAIGNQTITLGDQIAVIQADFSDPDDNNLRYSITPDAAVIDLNFNATTGVLRGRPNAAGAFTYTISATDGTNTTPGTPFTITVNDAANPAPQEASTIADQTIALGSAIATVQADFTDPNNDPLTYSIDPSAATIGLNFNPGNGELSGTPDTDGIFNFTITASDGTSSTPGTPFTITVTVGNRAPFANATIPDQTVAAGAAIAPANAEFNDPDGDALTFSTEPNGVLANTGLSLSSDGIVTGTPTFSNSLSLAIVASDGQLSTPSNTFTITIQTNANSAPNFGPEINDQNVTVNTDMTAIDANDHFTDPDGDTLTFTISPAVSTAPGLAFVNGVLSGRPTQPDDFEFTITANDGEFEVQSNEFEISVSGGIQPPPLPDGTL